MRQGDGALATERHAVVLEELLEQNGDTSEAEIREGISGNLCRCTGYVNIVKAIQQAAGTLSAAESAPVVAAETTEGVA